MNAFTSITPMKAAELVEAAGIDNARQIIADHTAAGLVRSYALVIETIDQRGTSECTRGGAVPVELWQRVVREGVADDVWSRGTVRLPGAELIGGNSAAVVTGITFSPKHIDRLIAHHVIATKATATKQGRTLPTAPVETHDDVVPAEPQARRAADPSAIPAGAMLATIQQAMAALGLSRGTINKLLDEGRLVRSETGMRAVRIDVASIRTFAGITP
ncbi:hypothetical protein SPAN111604_05585 [Sphingomonas antarctica]|uniref:hypothetical protein n=1 Tax=Sphingomonas antarctica TaxID=2040274 RepID=UPI0039ECA348